MFGIDSSEFLLLGAVALVVLGPKDLPRLMRTAGQWVAKARRLSSHVRASVDEMIRQAEVAAGEGAPDLNISTSSAQLVDILITPNTRSREPGGEHSMIVPLRPGALAMSFAPGPQLEGTAAHTVQENPPEEYSEPAHEPLANSGEGSQLAA